jgi:hypothetical protein
MTLVALALSLTCTHIAKRAVRPLGRWLLGSRRRELAEGVPSGHMAAWRS